MAASCWSLLPFAVFPALHVGTDVTAVAHTKVNPAPLPSLLHPHPGPAHSSRYRKRKHTSEPPRVYLGIVRRRIPGYFLVVLVPPALLMSCLARPFLCCASTWNTGVPQGEDEDLPKGGGEGDAECTSPVDAYEQVMTQRDAYTIYLVCCLRVPSLNSLAPSRCARRTYCSLENSGAGLC